MEPIHVVVASVWLVHGLYNKLLGGSPRHLAIVQSIPGLNGATGELALTIVGAFEVLLAAWVLSRRAPHVCAAAQTVTLLSMNAIELTFARHLLLWPAGLVPVNLAFLALAWTRLWPFLLGAALGVPLGVWVLALADPAQVRKGVAAFLVLYSLYGLARPALPPVKAGAAAAASVGFLNGVLGGMTGLAGILVTIWCGLRGWKKDEQRAG